MKPMQIVNTLLVSIFLSGTFTTLALAQNNAASGNLQSVTKRNAGENPDSLLQKGRKGYDYYQSQSGRMNKGGNESDSLQNKANIHTSRSNIKRGMRSNPADSSQNKANIHTSRSNIKRGMMNNPPDSVQKAGGHNSTRSNVQRNY